MSRTLYNFLHTADADKDTSEGLCHVVIMMSKPFFCRRRRPMGVALYLLLSSLALISAVLVLIAVAPVPSSWSSLQISTSITCNCTACSGVGRRDDPADEAPLPSDWETLGQSRNTERILEQERRNGTTPCHNIRTMRTEIVGLPPDDRPVRILTDEVFVFRLVSIGEDGKARCAGGDYYEVDLAGDHWKSRPQLTDLDDGTYEVRILVDGRKPGLYNFTARLLFANLHGLDHNPQPWRLSGEIAAEFALEIVKKQRRRGAAAGREPSANVISSTMQVCSGSEMVSAGSGGGRWTRGEYNRSCTANRDDGRWQCLSGEAAQCERPWCDGEVAALESNGWVYSDRRCGFRIFTTEEAWQCLAGRWLFMWGDSNMLDFLRNLLIFGLDYPPPSWANISTWEMNRVVEQPLFINPRRPDQAVRVSYVFNGHPDTAGDWLGLDSLLNSTYRNTLRRFFNGSAGRPDAFIFNTGLHDGIHYRTVAEFADAVAMAADFWADVFRPAVGKRLQLLLRTTVAPAGPARWNKSNPQKMEAFNAVLLDGFRKRFAGIHIIDAFDATFPFHYDFSCSDGGHYGRPPGIRRWPWFDTPHHYFVEVMLVHMMLNSVCSPAPPFGSTAASFV